MIYYVDVIIILLNSCVDYRNDELCDVKLIGRTGEEILAHKSVLAASSEYFNVLFSGKFKDFDKSEINIPELDPVVLELLIDFFYTYELNISEDYVQVNLFLLFVC